MEKIIISKKFGSSIIWIPIYLSMTITTMIVVASDISDFGKLSYPSFFTIFTILLLMILPFFLKLKIEITSDEIHYTVFPFVNKSINMTEVQKLNIFKISAFKDFLGIGYKKSKEFGWGYITEDGSILQVSFKNGDKINFSIEESETLKNLIQNHNLITQSDKS